MNEPRRRLHRSHAAIALMIALPLLCVLFVSLLVIQQQEIKRGKVERAFLESRIGLLEGDVLFYRSAYRTTLEDIRQLNMIYGGQARYEALAADMRRQELERFFDGFVPETVAIGLAQPGVWREYIASGAISTACLGEPTTVELLTDEILVTFDFNTTSGPVEAIVFLDGNGVRTVLVDGETTFAFTAEISSGLHEMTVVGDAGLTVSRATIETIVLPVPTIDAGSEAAGLDCIDAQAGSQLSGPGAIRYYLRVD